MSSLLGSSVGAVIPSGAAGTAALADAGVKRPSDGAVPNKVFGTADCVHAAREMSSPGLAGVG